MRRLLLSCALALLPPTATRAADGVAASLIDARTAAGGAAVFDGSRLLRPAAGPVAAGAADAQEAPPTALQPAPTRAPSPAAAAPAPIPASGISDGYIGLYPEDSFVLSTGRCAACDGPREGMWYFPDDLVATPKVGPAGLVWIGSHELVADAVLSENGQALRLKGGGEVPFSLVPKLPSNRSYYDASTLAGLRGRRLRLRGEFVEKDGARTFVARTLWPEDWRLDPSAFATADAKDKDGVDALVAADAQGKKDSFSTKVLWERPGEDRAWDGKPVMGFMLNGAQGDDDEALAGHFSFFSGRVGPGGGMADWMFDNFYDMDQVSEKGIIAAMVPMDKYMTDLNSGQSWYRPTDMLVMVMGDPRVPLQLQEAFRDRYAQYYAHSIRYDHTHSPCTAQIVDPLRQNGWNFPEQGRTPTLVAHLVAKLASLNSKDPEQESKLYDILRQEPTHLYPRAAFDSLGGDVLSLAGATDAQPLGRELSPLERRIQEDLVAVLYVHLPQLPSSRAFGRDPAGGFLDYFHRTPLDRSKWRTIPSVPRPFPPPH